MTALVIVGVVGTMLSAYGSYQQAQSQASQQEAAAEAARAQAQYTANVNTYNADVAEQNAADVRKKAAYDAALQRDKLKRAVGAQRLDYAAAGVELSSGSPLETMLQQVRDSELDIQATIYNGELEATEYERKAKLLRYSGQNALTTGYATASNYDSAADSTRTAGTIGAGATILTGASNTYGAYYGYGNKSAGL